MEQTTIEGGVGGEFWLIPDMGAGKSNEDF